jgi:GTPase SAR1 family protein
LLSVAKIQAALNVGEKPWNRSKIMLVGEGRAGKTALAKSLVGSDFVHTESTRGIEQFGIVVSHARLGPAWRHCEAPENALESAVITLVQEGAAANEPVSVVAHPPEGALDAGNDTERRATTGRNVISSHLLSPLVGEGSPLQVTPSFPVPLSGPVVSDGVNNFATKQRQLCSLDQQTVERIRSTLLNNDTFRGSDLMVKLYDFAGQDVFSCLHTYFLTRHGIYIIVFDMNWFTVGSAHSAAALENISFWLNSVAMNTMTESTKAVKRKTVAPIFLVGSHKDQVADAAVHILISDLLRRVFSDSVAWPLIVENDSSNLVYFPVDCTLGVADATITQLMSLMERSIYDSEYISIKRPLQWYKALDAFQNLSCPTISLSEAADTALDCGVDSGSVLELLGFLRDMGVLMWYDEPGLRETIILDPIAFFVEPVTRVICQMNVHESKLHSRCRKMRYEDFTTLFERGISSPALLNDLLANSGEGAEMLASSTTLISLMLKYGLAMCWQSSADDTGGSTDTTKYFIPSLFPVTSSSPTSRAWVPNDTVRTMYFVFSLDKTVGCRVLTEIELPSTGFLPKGLFDRLVCATLNWCNETEAHSNVMQFTLCKSYAVLKAAGVWFQMTLVPTNRCIRVDVAADNLHSFATVINGLYNRWRSVIISGLRSLVTTPFLPYMGQTNHHLLLVPMVISAVGLINGDACRDTWGMVGVGLRYHCFLSYRWGDFDKRFVTLLHEHMTSGMIRGLRWRAFLDIKVFHSGDPIPRIYFDSVLASEVLIPVVSPNALQRLVNHNPQEVDNLLIEWLTAVLLVKYADLRLQTKSSLRFICPICFKSAARDGYFDIISSLSQSVPTATITDLKELFSYKGFTLPSEAIKYLDTVTVKRIVGDVMKSFCLELDIADDLENSVHKCGEEAMALFFRADEVKVPPEHMTRIFGNKVSASTALMSPFALFLFFCAVQLIRYLFVW